MGRMLMNLDKAQARSAYKIQGNAPEARKLAETSKSRETPPQRRMGIQVVNPITKGDRTTKGNRYESGRIDKSRS